MEHVPSWARLRPCDQGGTGTQHYAPQFRTDREWYDKFSGEGHVGKREKHCHTSGHSFPLGL
jgi:hypothetical protein